MKRKQPCCGVCGEVGHRATNKIKHPDKAPVSVPPRVENQGPVVPRGGNNAAGGALSDEDDDSEADPDPNMYRNPLDDADVSDSDFDEDQQANGPVPAMVPVAPPLGVCRAAPPVVVADLDIPWAPAVLDDVPQVGIRSPREVANGGRPIFKPRLKHGRKLVGRTYVPAADEKPIDTFCRFFSEDMLKHMVEESNLYASTTAAEGNAAVIKPISEDEMCKFIGIVFALGIVKYPNRDIAWGPNGSTKVQQAMARKRFEEILKVLHWDSTAGLTPAEKKAKSSIDPFWSIQGLVDELCKNSKANYWMSQGISVDEMTVPCKARHRCKCYNPNKPFKWHFKMFALCEACSGYVWDFYMYTGKSEQRPAGISATEWPVRKLCADPFLHNNNHILACDNWFTSITLFV